MEAELGDATPREAVRVAQGMTVTGLETVRKRLHPGSALDKQSLPCGRSKTRLGDDCWVFSLSNLMNIRVPRTRVGKARGSRMRWGVQHWNPRTSVMLQSLRQ